MMRHSDAIFVLFFHWWLISNCKILFHRIKSLHLFFNINTGLVYNIRTSLNEVPAYLQCLWGCLVATWCFIAQLLTTGSFVLDVNGPLQGTTHRSHLAGTAVAVAVRSAHWVGRLRAGLGALAHRLVVLDHAHCPMIAHLIQAGARYAEIWRANTEETESKVRWGGGDTEQGRWGAGRIQSRGWRKVWGLKGHRWQGGRLERSYMGNCGFCVRKGLGTKKGTRWNMQHSPVPVTPQLPQLPMSFPRLCAYPDASWIFEDSSESTGMGTADKNMAPWHNRDETACEQWVA